VLDANSFITGAVKALPSAALLSPLYTVDAVLGEVRDARARFVLETLPVALTTREPAERSIAAVTAFARATGDLPKLSATDIAVLALAHQMELEANGSQFIRTAPATLPTKAGMLAPPHSTARAAGRKAGAVGGGAGAAGGAGAPVAVASAAPAAAPAAAAVAAAPAAASDSTAPTTTADAATAPVLEVRYTAEGEASGDDGDSSDGDDAAAAAAPGDDAAEPPAPAAAADAPVVADAAPAGGAGGEKSKPAGPRVVAAPPVSVDDAEESGDEDGGEWEEVKAHKSSTAGKRGRRRRAKAAAAAAAAAAAPAAPAVLAAAPTPAATAAAAAAAAPAPTTTSAAVPFDEPDEGEWVTPCAPGGGSALAGGVAFGYEKIMPGGGVGEAAAAAPPSRRMVVTMTSDFAMQNVLLQMGLNLVSPGGLVVRSVKHWVLQCDACFTITPDTAKLFCPRCGNATLARLGVTLGADGTPRYHYKRNRTVSKRGTQAELPRPTGGRGGDLLLREDQLLTGYWAQKAKTKVTTTSMFADRAAGSADDPTLGMTRTLRGAAAGEIVVGYGRKNRNEAHRRKR